jgi:hypothetical protein
MSGNLQRGTAGRFLIAWALLMSGSLLFAWRVQLHPADYQWIEWPTALGDRTYYGKLSENDFYSPVLRFEGHEAGLFRRMVNPVLRDDARMIRLTRESSGTFFVYTYAKPSGRYYLKAADDRYVEFGERLFWPEYQPPKAIPYKPAE